MTKVSVEIVRETRKAKLVRDAQGREAWVQNRSYKEGLVNESVFEKGVEFLAERAEEAEEARIFNESMHTLDVVWESEKAIAIDREADFVAASSLYHTKRVRVFFPRANALLKMGNGRFPGGF